MKGSFQNILPRSFRIFVRRWLQDRKRRRKAPTMLLGWSDASGGWQERTRVSDTVSMYRIENIRIGNNVFIGHFCILDGTNELVIEDGVQLAGWNGVYTHSSHIAIRLYGRHYGDVPENEKVAYRAGKVHIRKYAFIGAGAKIFSGVTIGKGALIYANAVVTRDVRDFEIVSGNPAVVTGDTRELDAKHLLEPQLRAWYDEWQLTEK